MVISVFNSGKEFHGPPPPNRVLFFQPQTPIRYIFLEDFKVKWLFLNIEVFQYSYNNGIVHWDTVSDFPVY